jgi:ribosomal protein S12 methylthiotransferase accessory factor
MSGWADSAYTGIFTRFGEVPARPHDPDVVVWSGSLAPWGPRGAELPVGGAAWDADGAREAALGEGVERLQPYPLPSDGSIEASFEEWPLHEPAVEPGRWVLFYREQYALDGFPFRPFTRRTRCRWISFREAVSGDPRWVPEELAYLFMPAGRAHSISPGISTGLSAGRAGQPVLLRGLQEVIERDAVVGAWWGRYSLVEVPPEDVLGSLPPGIDSRLLRPNLRHRFFRIGSPFSAHVTLAAIEGEERTGRCFAVGSACRETLAASWMKSIVEAVHGYRYVRHLKERRDAPLPGDHPSTFEEHALHYAADPSRVDRTVLGAAGAGAVPPGGSGERPGLEGAEPEDVTVLAGRLGKDRPVLFRSMTPPGIASELGDWVVLKVLVPGLQPLHGNHLLAHLGGPLWAPRGLAEYADVPPHPFP